MRDRGTYLTGTLPNRYLTSLPHYSCLGPNLHSREIFTEGDNEDCQLLTGEPFPFKYTLPVPLLRMKKTHKLFLYGKDPGLEVVYRKMRWKEIIQRELTGFLQHNRFQDIPFINKELKRKRGLKKLPTSVVLLSKLLEYDPDDQFDGFYNWYCYGGCLSHAIFEGSKFLLRSSGLKFDRLEAVPLRGGKSIYLKPDKKYTTKFDIGNKSPIYQISTDRECEYVGLRQDRQCKIVSVVENSDILRFCSMNEFKSESSSFTSIAFDDINKGNFATMDTSSTVCIRNVDQERPFIDKWIVPSSSQNSVDKWCCAQYGQNRDSIICINRQYVRTYDVRANNMNTMEFCCKDYVSMLEKCEELTCIVEGSQKSSHPLLYISTHHSLLGMDLRFPRAFVQRWTHGMETAPSYACVACIDGEGGGNPLEAIILRSQITNELRVVVNYPSSKMFSVPFSSFLPKSLPSYSDTLKFGQWNGKLLDPLTQRRLSMATMGMCCFGGEDGVITCLSQNSIGDVFQQHLIPMANEHNLTAKHVVRHLTKWEKSMPKEKRPQKKLETVVRTDMKALVNRVKNMPSEIIERSKYIRTDWKISKEKLLQFTDLLAERIRGVWELDDEPEWKSNVEPDDEEDEPIAPTQEPVDKVHQWLGASCMFTSTPVAFQESQDSAPLSFRPQLLETQFSEFDNVSPNPAIVQETKRRPPVLEPGRTKRRRIDGF